jgi:hypothetical protein
MMANLENYQLISWDRDRTIGVVKDGRGRQLLGWSRDPIRDAVHVVGMYGGEWRGEGLESTISDILDEIESDALNGRR